MKDKNSKEQIQKKRMLKKEDPQENEASKRNLRKEMFFQIQKSFKMKKQRIKKLLIFL